MGVCQKCEEKLDKKKDSALFYCMKCGNQKRTEALAALRLSGLMDKNLWR